MQRHQLVLDLTRPEVADYLFGRISGLLAEYPISYVKWDCNRDIIDAGCGVRAGAPAAHEQTLAVYALLDRLRERHPDVEWESCAAGGTCRCRCAAPRRCSGTWVSSGPSPRPAVPSWPGWRNGSGCTSGTGPSPNVRSGVAPRRSAHCCLRDELGVCG